MITAHPGEADRPEPVAVYVVAGDEASAGLFLDHCRRYAEERGWPVVVEAVDLPRVFGEEDGLAGRPGWEKILASLSDGTAHGVITWDRRAVVRTAGGWERFVSLVTERGRFIVAAAAGDVRRPMTRRSLIRPGNSNPNRVNSCARPQGRVS